MIAIATLAKHVVDLCDAFGVGLEIDKQLAPDGARAMTQSYQPDAAKKVRVHPIIDETTYCVALHEIGHCVSPTGMMFFEWSLSMRLFRQPTSVRDIRIALEMEDAAWMWAKHYALEWTPLMQNTAAMCLATYTREARRVLGTGGLPR